MTDDLVRQADAFRLVSEPTDQQVDQANWLLDRMSSRIEELEFENKLLSEGATIAHLRGAMDAHANRADDIWAEFKDKWDGEKKFALRQITKWLREQKNTPGGWDAGGSCPPRADGSGEDG
jgi:hypothetical protein